MFFILGVACIISESEIGLLSVVVGLASMTSVFVIASVGTALMASVGVAGDLSLPIAVVTTL